MRLLLFLLLLSSTLYAVVIDETGSLAGFIYGSEPACEYDDWMLHITKKVQYGGNVFAPFVRNDFNFPFGTYRVPNTTELEQWSEVCSYFINHDYRAADSSILLYGFPYQIVRFNDTDTGRRYYMLREKLNMNLYDDQGTPETTDDVQGGFDYSWGLYIVNHDEPLPIVLTYVHPSDDYTVPPLLVKAFEEWEAKYVLLAGASREAAPSVGFTNNNSISDPSRFQNHPFNQFYTQACDEIRSSFMRREYSVQLHSYDWASPTHAGVSNIQLSAGPGHRNPNLPLRDFSSFRLDVVNLTDYLVFPANTIGFHDPVFVTDYYTVYYDPATMPFYYDDGEHFVTVPSRVTLPGASNNVQYMYTREINNNQYELVNPFLHIELDELPYCYPQTEYYWKWFYGYNLSTQSFDMSNRFTHSFEYYSPFIAILGKAIRAAIALDDNLPVETPANFTATNQTPTTITVRWTPVDSYDFDTYEIAYHTSNNNEPVIKDKSNTPSLARVNTNNLTITGLTSGTTFYTSIRAKDRNGNISPTSEEVSTPIEAITSIVMSANNILSLDSSVSISWRGEAQSTSLLGYKVYRANTNGAIEMIASYETQPNLQRFSTSQDYSYTDNTAENYVDYMYFISACSSTNEFPHYLRLRASPRPMYQLYFTSENGSASDFVTLGFSPFASDGDDFAPAYDVNYSIIFEHYIRAGTAGYFNREVKSEFDMDNGYKSFAITLRTNQRNVNIFLSDVNINRLRKIIWEDTITQHNINLLDGRHSFTLPTNVIHRNYQVHLGNVRPEPTVIISQDASNKIYTSGDELSFSYSTRFYSLLDHYEIKIVDTTNEIVIATNAAAHADSVNFIIPDGVTMHDVSLLLVAHCTDGEIVEYTTHIGIGIIPSTTTISFTTQNSFVTNPFPYNPLSLSALGLDGELYRLINQNWESATQMTFSEGYLLKATEDFSQTYTGVIQQTQTSISLTKGWNLIPNPFLSDLNIQDFSFNINTSAYSYAELLLGNVLLPYARVLRGGILTNTDHILPQEAFLLYANLPPETTSSIVLTPYIHNPPTTQNYFIWQTSINVNYENDETISDAVVISAVNGIPPHNNYIIHHNPKNVPLPNGILFYLQQSPADTNKYHSRTIAKLSEESYHYIAIPFTLELPSLQPLIFSQQEMIEELDYYTTIAINEVEYSLPLQYLPTELIITGEIRIANEQMLPITDTVVTPLRFSVYPNPFNPATNIAFTIEKDTFIECAIYNIKGQKVKTIAAQHMKRGNHTITWNGVDTFGRASSSGIYFVSIAPQGQKRVVKKITLLK